MTFFQTGIALFVIGVVLLLMFEGWEDKPAILKREWAGALLGMGGILCTCIGIALMLASWIWFLVRVLP